MRTSRLRTAVIGTGFMARVHLEAIRRLGFVDIQAVAGATQEKARPLADAFGGEAYGDYRDVLRHPDIDAVHICTPNFLHFPVASAALTAGKHVLCEKPLATTSAEAMELARLADERGLRNCICHNLRYYPMVQQMRSMREAGDVGEILSAQGTYLQDWLLWDTDWNWRVESKSAGPLRALGDIGSHWCDMLEHVSGLQITSLCADVATFHQTRTRSRVPAETFAAAGAAASGQDTLPVDTEDFGSVLLRLGTRARGAFTVSQMSAGRKNYLSLEIYGSKASMAWNQERPNELWIGHRDVPNQILTKDPALLTAPAAAFADLPGGHTEGYGDTFKQVFRRFYQSIVDPDRTADYPQFADGLRQMRILDAERASSQAQAWVAVTP